MLNQMRVVQGWNLMPVSDAEPLAAIWIEQLDRHGIFEDEYESLFHKSLDWRIKCLKDNQPLPALTLETLIASKNRAL